MNNQEILTKAIEKAIARGWESEFSGYETLEVQLPVASYMILVQFEGTYDGGERWVRRVNYEAIIYSHDFAKDLWPEQYGVSGSVDPRAVSLSTARPLLPTWQTHLMEMVIADDPIKYLGEHI